MTGAGSGIGRAIALALAEDGAEVLLVGREVLRLEAVASEIQARGGKATAHAANVTDVGTVDELVEEIDVLVHSAASFATYACLGDVPLEELESVFATGLASVARLDGRALAGMKQRGFGRLIYIGSHAGVRGAKRQAAYSAAKAGLVGLMRSAALEGAREGVTANLLELGLIDTERVRDVVSPEIRERIVARTPVGRIGSPGEVAEAALFLASPRASYITGVVLPISGGLGLGLFPEQLG